MAWGAVALLLLIASANTASLMLGRAASRRREIAICRALGASRRHLAARVAGECLVLSLAGGVLGLPIALVLLKAAVTLAPPDLPRLDDAAIDLPVLAFTAALSVITALLFGAVPAARGSRAGVSDDLRAGGGRGAVGAPHARLRQLAVSCQVGLTIVVLVAAALLLRSFARLVAVDPGFDGARVLTMTVTLPDAKYGDPGRRVAFFHELVERARALPGVEAAGFVSHAPLAGAPLVADVRADGEGGGQGRTLLANCSVIGGEWFATLGIPMVRGRAFTDRDRTGAPPVVIVSARLAAALWPGVDPIGRRLVIGTTLGADPRPHDVVGVAGDVRSALEAGPGDQVYLPHAQNPWPTMAVMIRTTGAPAQWAVPLRSAVYALDPDQAVDNVRPYGVLLARALAARRFQLLVLSLFAAAGLLVAVTGVYSVVAYGVRERRQELGVRLALGAGRRDLLWLTTAGSLRWAAAGLAGGGVVAFWMARALSGALYGVGPADALSFVAASGVAAAMVMLGSLAGAWGALTLDPLAALRD
jgi:predicted permease